MALLVLAVLGPSTLRAQAVTRDTTAPEELLAQLRLEYGPDAVLVFLARDSTLLVPLRRLLELAEVRVTAVRDSQRVEGLLEPGRVPFSVDLATRRLTRGDSVLAVPPEAAVWYDGDLYLALPLLQPLLHLTFEIDRSELTVFAHGTKELPVVRRIVREQQRRRLLGGAADDVGTVPVRLPRRWADGALLDWAYTGSVREPWSASLTQLGLGMQVVGGSLALQYQHAQSGTSGVDALHPSWTGAWSGQRVRQLRLGDIVTGGRQGRTLRGLEITNSPYLRPSAFGLVHLGTFLEPGWEADVYQNGELLAYLPADSVGRLQTIVPVGYGTNSVELVGYGPHGEVLRRSRVLQIESDRLPARRLEYAVAGGRCLSTPAECRGSAAGTVRYGLTSAVTTELGAEWLRRDGRADRVAPSGAVSATPLPALAFTIEGAAHDQARALLEYAPSLDFHVELQHERLATQPTDTGTATATAMAIAGDTGTLEAGLPLRVRTEATAFWRPDASRPLTFLQLGLRRETQGGDARSTARLAVTQRLVDFRVQVALNLERALTRGISRTTAGGDLLVDGAFARLLPALRGTFTRLLAGTGEGGGLDRLAVSLSRQVGAARVDLGTNWTRAEHHVALELGLTSMFGGVRAGHQSRYTAAEGLQGLNTLEGSIGYDRHLRRLEFGQGRDVGRARIAGRAFVDANGNGQWDAGEATLPGLTLQIGSHAVHTDSSGRYSVPELVPFEPTLVEVDTLSTPDPTLVPVDTRFRLTPAPNGYVALDVPFIAGRELSGRIVWEDSTRRAPPGAALVVRDLRRGRTRRLTTFSDGSFYTVGLPPGEYELAIEPRTLAALHAQATPLRFTLPGAGPERSVTLTLSAESSAAPATN